jgi:hypothetical protein
MYKAGRKKERCGSLCRCFLSFQCDGGPGGEAGWETHRRYEDTGSFQGTCQVPESSVWAGRLLTIQVSVYVVPHGTSYTRGFSVSATTPSVQTSFFFFPSEEIRKLFL